MDQGIIICPVCRSQLRAVGYVDYSAPSVSQLICPVCGAPNFVPSTLNSGLLDTLFPMRWTFLDVLVRNDPVKTWEQIKVEQPEQTAAIEAGLPGTDKPIWNNFTFDLTKLYPNLTGAVTGSLILLLIIAVIVLIIIFKK